MNKVADDIEAWASAYIEFQLDSTRLTVEHPLWWAVERFMNPLSETTPEDCWIAILVILARNPPDEVMSMLAAGPLEDFIGQAGRDFIGRIEAEARINPKFRRLLRDVWESGEADVWARVELARAQA